MKKFVFVIDGKVQMKLSFPEDRPDSEMKVAGLNSNPIIVEITDFNEKPSVGWTWDGLIFSPPID